MEKEKEKGNEDRGSKLHERASNLMSSASKLHEKGYNLMKLFGKLTEMG